MLPFKFTSLKKSPLVSSAAGSRLPRLKALIDHSAETHSCRIDSRRVVILQLQRGLLADVCSPGAATVQPQGAAMHKLLSMLYFTRIHPPCHCVQRPNALFVIHFMFSVGGTWATDEHTNETINLNYSVFELYKYNMGTVTFIQQQIGFLLPFCFVFIFLFFSTFGICWKKWTNFTAALWSRLMDRREEIIIHTVKPSGRFWLSGNKHVPLY